MKARCSTSVRFLLASWAALFAVTPAVPAQTPPVLNIQLYAGLSITGAVGQSYSVQYTTNLAQTNAWLTLTNVLLANSPYLLFDSITPGTAQRFYRAVLVSPSPPRMVWVPPGTFTMGSPTNELGRFDWEGPQTVVTLTYGFYIGKFPVTQAEYISVVGNNPSVFSPTNGYAETLNRPVEMLSWQDAKNYCTALTQQEQAAGRLPAGWLYRLPTEAEWEYACRAGTTTRFSYGDDPTYATLMYYAWYGLNSASQTHPVGQKTPNQWGLCDMQGNVAEMCQDWWGPYPGGSVTNPQGPPSGSEVVIRSCGWACADPRTLRSAMRNNWPGAPLNWIGFRVVLAPSQP